MAFALAGPGVRLALVASTADAGAALTVQRLARSLAAAGTETHAQAINAANEMAVRVMVRQVAKEMGGLDAAVFCAEAPGALQLALRFAGRELARTGGPFVTLTEPLGREDLRLLPENVSWADLPAHVRPLEDVVAEAVRTVAAVVAGR